MLHLGLKQKTQRNNECFLITKLTIFFLMKKVNTLASLGHDLLKVSQPNILPFFLYVIVAVECCNTVVFLGWLGCVESCPLIFCCWLALQMSYCLERQDEVGLSLVFSPVLSWVLITMLELEAFVWGGKRKSWMQLHLLGDVEGLGWVFSFFFFFFLYFLFEHHNMDPLEWIGHI